MVSRRLSVHNEESGFTILEVMVAIFILLLGVLGVTTMMNSANAVTNTTKAREAATNLSRQLIEVSRTLPYSTLDNASLNTALQQTIPDDDPGTTGWQVNRRGHVLVVRSHACVFDVRKDLGRPTGTPGTWCPGSAAEVSTTPADQSADDERRVEFTVEWTTEGKTPDCSGNTNSNGTVHTGNGTACVVQSALIANPSGGLGPNVQSVSVVYSAGTLRGPDGTIDAGSIEAPPTGSSITFTANMTSPADSVNWQADDGISGGSADKVAADTTNKTWTFTWNLPNGLVDGPHTITIQGFLSTVAGSPFNYVQPINRHIPPSPDTNFSPAAAAGVNTRLSEGQTGVKPIVEINWQLVRDNDILGYTIFRTRPPNVDPVLQGNIDPVVCPDTSASSSAMVAATVSSCFDPDPPAPNAPAVPGANMARYYIVAFDTPWTNGAIQNPTVYGAPAGNCPQVAANLNVNLGPPLFDQAAQRPGCPSVVIPVDIDVGAQNPRPVFPGGFNITATTDSTGLPSLAWTAAQPANNGGPEVQFYRVYRDPSSTSRPPFSQRYSRSSVNSFTDPSPGVAASHTYSITAVDSNWQESDPIVVTWTKP